MSAPGGDPSRIRAAAERLLNAGDAAKAEPLLQILVAAAPDDARAWHLLGTARYRNGRVEPAVAAFRRRLELSPDDPVAYYSLGIALRDLGEIDEARRHLHTAVQLRPDFAPARQRLAELELGEPTGPQAAPALPGHPEPALRPAGAPQAAPAGAPLMEPSGRGVVGRARHVQQRAEAEPWTRGTVHRLTFRVERVDDDGTSLSPVPVEMRGSRIHGTIGEGDWVEVEGRWRPGRTLRSGLVRNLTTYETIRARNTSRLLVLSVVVLFVAAFGYFAVWVGTNIVAWRSAPFTGPSPPAPRSQAVQPPAVNAPNQPPPKRPDRTPSPNSQPSPSRPGTPETITVRCAPSGASGQSKTVPVGTTIRFLNTTSDQMKVTVKNGTATGGGPVALNGSWSFTFKEAGTYLYTCSFQKAPGEQSGTIVVTGG